MIADLVLTNAKAYFKQEIVECCIAVENGEIEKIGKETQMPKADERINLRNLLVLPGLIDVHVHLRDEGKAYKEDFYSGTAAAAAGGFTTVLDMPNNEPVTMSPEILKNRMNLASKRVLVNVGFYSEFPNNLNQVKEIVDRGAIGFKLFMAHKVGGVNANDDEALHEAFDCAGEASALVAVHAEDEAKICALERPLRAGKHNNPAAFLKAHPPAAEIKAVERVLNASANTAAHVHFCHISTEKSLEKVVEAKQKGANVSCEVTPNHLLLSTRDFESQGALLTMMPPLRNQTDIETLWQGITQRAVDVIGSDHAPHTLEEKSADSIWDVKVGVPGLETTLPLMLTMIKKNRLTLGRLVELLAEKPAELFKLKGRSELARGMKADFAVVDLKAKFTIDPSTFHSKAKYSPYKGWEVQGKPVKTYVNGHLVMDEGEIVAKPGSGAVIRREND